MLTNILNSQPQGHPQINRGNPLARGLVAVVIDGVFNPVNDRPYTLGAGFAGAMFRAYSPQGVALSVDGPSNPTATITLQTSGLDTRSFSVAGKIRTRAVGGAGVGARAGTGNIVLWRNTGWDCRIGGTDYTAGGTYNLNEVYDYALTSSASAVGLYVNGQSVIAGGVGGAGTLSDMQMFIDGAGGGSHFLDVWWFGVWNRPLTALEVQELRVNPWQIFDSAPSIPLIGIAATGPATYNDSFTESLAAGDSYAASAIYADVLTASVAASDAKVGVLSISESIAAAISAADSVLCAATMAESHAAAVTAGEALACVHTLLETLAESVAPGYSQSDSLNGGGATYNETHAAGITAGDSMVSGQVLVEALTVALTVAESLTSSAVYRSAIAEAISTGFSAAALAALIRNTRYTMPNRARTFTAPDRARTFWTGMT